MQLRARSYVMAFIFGVVYAILQPYINYVVALILKKENAGFEELSSFVIIWFFVGPLIILILLDIIPKLHHHEMLKASFLSRLNLD